jgi:hypothetical protein
VKTLRWDWCGYPESVADLYLSRSGSAGPFETIALDQPNTGSYNWIVTGPTTSNAFFKVVLRNAVGQAEDLSNSAFSIIHCGPCVVDYCGAANSRCTFNDTCGAGGCCNYTCSFDPTCTAPDPCPSGACGCN